MHTVQELLSILSDIAKDMSLNTPYVVGGIPRDILLNRLSEVNDIDITNGSRDIDVLADAFAKKVDGQLNDVGDHFQVIIDNIAFDFSSNFVYENIDKLVNKEMNSLEKEIFSRDFTINTITMPLDLSGFKDITGMGFNDLKKGIIRCPVDCTESLQASPNRIMRALLYKAKLGFKLDPSLSRALVDNRDLIKKIHPRYASSMLNSMVRADENILDFLIDTEILHALPMTKLVTRKLIEKKRLVDII